MHIKLFTSIFLLVCLCVPQFANSTPNGSRLFPQNSARNISPDTQIIIEFSTKPEIGNSGLIEIIDLKENKVIDTLDLSIPFSPNPDGRAPRRSGASGPAVAPRPGDVTIAAPQYQITKIGGTEFHFFPIIIDGNKAQIYPHHGVLQYDKEYEIRIGAGVFKSEGHSNLNQKWTFKTKRRAPNISRQRFVVAKDGSGDFNSIQGAIDAMPDGLQTKKTIFIRNGNYRELVFMNNKSNLILRGESRDGVIVGYSNNSAFNPPKGGPSRRPAFSIYNSTNIQLSTFTINNYFIGQAEALLIRGSRNIIDRMNLNGSGDALTMYGSAYLVETKLTGDGDTCLCYGPAFFLRSEIQSVGPFSWTRNPQTNHGNIFVDSKFVAIDKPLPWSVDPNAPDGVKVSKVFARLPRNSSATATSLNFPFAEMVLINSTLVDIPEIGWGPIQDEPDFSHANLHLWEYNSRDLSGNLIDVSKRHAASRQLKLPEDKEIIENYQKPEFVLDGWKPIVQ